MGSRILQWVDVPKERAPRIPSSEWDIHYPQLRLLYIERDLTLDQTMDIMLQEHGFSAR